MPDHVQDWNEFYLAQWLRDFHGQWNDSQIGAARDYADDVDDLLGLLFEHGWRKE